LALNGHDLGFYFLHSYSITDDRQLTKRGIAVIRTEIDLTNEIGLKEFCEAIQRIEYAYDRKKYATKVSIESGDLTDDVHRLVFITIPAAE
jgi:hypothetical protein